MLRKLRESILLHRPTAQTSTKVDSNAVEARTYNVVSQKGS